MRTVAVAIGLVLCLCCAACSEQPTESASPQAVRAFVTIPPQAFFVKKIGGDRVKVDVMVPPGQSPHSFEPSPREIAKLSNADVYFAIGEIFEQQLLPKFAATNPRMRIVDTRAGITLRPADNDEDSRGRVASVRDPHIWLAPALVKVQAKTICDALSDLDPSGRPEYEKHLRAFLAELDAEDARISALLAEARGKDFFVYHPSFGYFADAYGLRQVPIEISGKEPSAREMATLIDRAKAEGVRVILVAPQFSEKSARAVAASIGGSVVRVDPYAEDYLTGLDAIAVKIHDAVAQEKPSSL